MTVLNRNITSITAKVDDSLTVIFRSEGTFNEVYSKLIEKFPTSDVQYVSKDRVYDDEDDYPF